MIFLFDTNIVLHYLRESSVMQSVKRTYSPFHPVNDCWMCTVSKGELRSIALQNKWGRPRLRQLEDLCAQFYLADISAEDVIDRYAEIDSFSQGKLPNRPLGLSARNMGKNDLWIAATASVLEATLLTTDADFDHLQGVYLDVARVVV